MKSNFKSTSLKLIESMNQLVNALKSMLKLEKDLGQNTQQAATAMGEFGRLSGLALK